MAAITVTGLTVGLTGKDTTIIEDVSLELGSSEVMGIVGESGSGKSTLALALLGYARSGGEIRAGSVDIEGTDLLRLDAAGLRAARRGLVSYVAQDPATALNPSMRLRTQLLEAIDGSREQSMARIREVLEAVGLPADDAFLKRRASELSGGQQQRIAIAMAVVAQPRLIVLDEPTTGLDVSTQMKVLELVKRLCAEYRIAAIYVTHDLAVVAEVADRVTVMYGGQVVETGSTASVLQAPAHPYTRALLQALPSTQDRHMLVPIPGRAPSIGDRPTGCVFAARCAFATDACRSAVPPLEPSGDGLVRCIRHVEIGQRPPATVSVAPVGDFEDRPDSVLRVADLRASYGHVEVLHGIDLDVRAGECLAIVGESGSGKSTLSRCLIGLHTEWEGELLLDGESLARSAAKRSSAARRRMQYIFQNPYGSLNPRLDVGTSLAAPLRHFERPSGAEVRRRVGEALERVEIPARMAELYPSELSGGQRQRVAIARALLADPSVLICDEVTSALDVSVQASVVELLRGLLQDGLSMIFVTHNLAVVRSIADSVAVLNRGEIVEQGRVDRVLDHPRDLYTQGLLADTLDLSAA
ncbi:MULTISPECIES: ABC transporter ATP-binding protein [unclassified Leucobacter]|uniref:ABC transporter ATP-binding protein n=1 Tax=unclassified Leucobacter TaxID=2621730 RepID=UPI0006221435|nr:ABC transporter ATP-binding protein [Leucobacter sp. Ag1]KKI16604.1 peptide ABC transporter ATP-binding protein [Leucobacter sp. Ag1]